MLSIVVEEPNSLAVCERPMPEPAAGEVRVRVRYAGICGSDLHIALAAKYPYERAYLPVARLADGSMWHW